MPLDTILRITADSRPAEQQIAKLTGKTYGINLNINAQPLGKITGQIGEFNKSLDAANARVVAFGASAGAVALLEKSFSALISSTIEVEKSLKDIQVVLGASDATISKFGKSLFDVAKNTGQSFSEVASAATELSRQGLSVEETLKRTNEALILSRLSGLSAAQSVETLTASVNSFANQAVTATQVVNKLANVDAAFAVSSKDLAEGISRVGASASQSGVSIDELIALITSAQQVTARGGAVIGNSFKTIFTRLERGKTQDLLESLGVSTKDTEGKLKSTIDLLRDLASVYGTLDKNKQAEVAEKVGGVFQINILKAALGDLGKEYSVYGSALKTSQQATDEAIARNEKLNQTYEAQINRLKENATQLAASAGKKVLGPAMDRVIGGGNSILESLNNADSTSVGAKLGQGILDGIGQIIAGPGLVLIGGVILKLLKDFAQFSTGSIKELLGLNNASKQQEGIQKSILSILESESALRSKINAELKSGGDGAKAMLTFLEQQTAQMQLQSKFASDIAAKLYSGGVRIGAQGVPVTKTPNKASGYIPSFSKEDTERLAAKNHKGGYNAGRVFERTLYDGSGGSFRATVNSAEKITDFKNSAGYKATIVEPPNGFAASGYVPNFANKQEIKQSKAYSIDELTRLSNGRFQNKKNADGADTFQSDIKIIRQQKSAKEYGQNAGEIAKKIITKLGAEGKEIDQDYLNAKIKEYETAGVDQSAIRSLNTAVKRIQPGIGKEGVKKTQNAYANIVNKIKGINGEIDAARMLNSRLSSGNAFFDLTSGEEVKTRGEQETWGLVKKTANNYLSTNNIANNNKDSIKQPMTVVLPSDGKLKASGYIPNFAETMEEKLAKMRERNLAKNRGRGGYGRGGANAPDITKTEFYNNSPIDLKGQNTIGLIHAEVGGGLIEDYRGTFRDLASGQRYKIGIPTAGINPRGAPDAELSIVDIIENKLAEATNDFTNRLFPNNREQVTKSDLLKTNPGAMKGIVGNAFEAAISKVTKSNIGRKVNEGVDYENVSPELRKIFYGISARVLEAKYSKTLVDSVAEKGYQKGYFNSRIQENKPVSTTSKQAGIKNTASGYIPNFANAINDSVQREMAAGVPKQKIYTKKYPQLASASNPEGWGVFNEIDEGSVSKEISAMRDKGYAASGYVPNFAGPFNIDPTALATYVQLGPAFSDALKETSAASKEGTDASKEETAAKKEAAAAAKESAEAEKQSTISLKEYIANKKVLADYDKEIAQSQKNQEGSLAELMGASSKEDRKEAREKYNKDKKETERLKADKADIMKKAPAATSLSNIDLLKPLKEKLSGTRTGGLLEKAPSLTGLGKSALSKGIGMVKSPGFGMIAPMITEAVTGFIGQDTKGGRATSQTVSSIGNIISGASTGAVLGGGVPGAVIGGTIAALGEIPKVVTAFTSTLPEATAAAAKSADALAAFNANTQSYSTASENLTNLLESGTASQLEIQKASEAYSEALSKFSEQDRAEIAKARQEGGIKGEKEKLAELGERKIQADKTAQRTVEIQKLKDEETSKSFTRKFTFGLAGGDGKTEFTKSGQSASKQITDTIIGGLSGKAALDKLNQVSIKDLIGGEGSAKQRYEQGLRASLSDKDGNMTAENKAAFEAEMGRVQASGDFEGAIRELTVALTKAKTTAFQQEKDKNTRQEEIVAERDMSKKNVSSIEYQIQRIKGASAIGEQRIVQEEARKNTQKDEDLKFKRTRQVEKQSLVDEVIGTASQQSLDMKFANETKKIEEDKVRANEKIFSDLKIQKVKEAGQKQDATLFVPPPLDESKQAQQKIEEGQKTGYINPFGTGELSDGKKDRTDKIAQIGNEQIRAIQALQARIMSTQVMAPNGTVDIEATLKSLDSEINALKTGTGDLAAGQEGTNAQQQLLEQVRDNIRKNGEQAERDAKELKAATLAAQKLAGIKNTMSAFGGLESYKRGEKPSNAIIDLMVKGGTEKKRIESMDKSIASGMAPKKDKIGMEELGRVYANTNTALRGLFGGQDALSIKPEVAEAERNVSLDKKRDELLKKRSIIDKDLEKSSRDPESTDATRKRLSSERRTIEDQLLGIEQERKKTVPAPTSRAEGFEDAMRKGREEDLMKQIKEMEKAVQKSGSADQQQAYMAYRNRFIQGATGKTEQEGGTIEEAVKEKSRLEVARETGNLTKQDFDKLTNIDSNGAVQALQGSALDKIYSDPNEKLDLLKGITTQGKDESTVAIEIGNKLQVEQLAVLKEILNASAKSTAALDKGINDANPQGSASAQQNAPTEQSSVPNGATSTGATRDYQFKVDVNVNAAPGTADGLDEKLKVAIQDVVGTQLQDYYSKVDKLEYQVNNNGRQPPPSTTNQ